MTGWDGYVPVLLCRQRSEDAAVAGEYVHLETLRAIDNRESRIIHWQERAKLTHELRKDQLEAFKQERRKKREASKLYLQMIPDTDKDSVMGVQWMCRRSGNGLLNAGSRHFRCNIKRKTNRYWVKYGLLADDLCVDPNSNPVNVRVVSCDPSTLPPDMVYAINSWQSDRNILRWVPAGPQWENAVFSELSKLFSVQS
jgi:hypothetical protein